MERRETGRGELAKQKNQQQLDKKENQFCEIDTLYCSDIDVIYNKDTANFQFRTIRALSKDFGVFDELKRGVAQLHTYKQLNQYIFSFGLMHEEKLKQAYQAIFEKSHLDLNGQNIEVIDYGCGQGLGAICLLDYIKFRTNLNCVVAKVKLIEPSKLALSRAALHVKYSLRGINQSENIHTLNKELDYLLEDDLATNNSSVKIHIFSNIIDIQNFELKSLSQKIIKSQKGINIFVCVSPNISSNSNHRLDNFQYYVARAGNLTLISYRQTDIDNPSDANKPWSRYERVFKVYIDHKQNETSILLNANKTAYILDENDIPY